MPAMTVPLMGHRNYAECMKTQKATFCTRHLDGVPQKTLMAAKG